MSQRSAVLAVTSQCSESWSPVGPTVESEEIGKCSRGARSTELMAEASPLFRKRTLTPESDEVIATALQRDAVARRILAKGIDIHSGDLVGVRLNLNVMKSTGVAVHTLHKGTTTGGHTRGRGFYRGEVIGYRPVVELREAYFNVHQASREGIAAGVIAKCPMASVDGRFLESSGMPSFDGVAIRFNPHAVHLFVDEAGYAVEYAERVTILGNRAYARGLIRYFSTRTAPARAGSGASAVRFIDS